MSLGDSAVTSLVDWGETGVSGSLSTKEASISKGEKGLVGELATVEGDERDRERWGREGMWKLTTSDSLSEVPDPKDVDVLVSSSRVSDWQEEESVRSRSVPLILERESIASS